jgi:hypothetical protein
MSVLEQKKREEGDEHVRQAEKHLKTSPLKFKFSPDWDPAGDEFSKAATCYKVAKDYEESKVYERYCLMKKKVGRNWHQSIHFDKLSCRQVSFFGP